MSGQTQIVKQLGDIKTGLYTIEKVDPFYKAYSGYQWIVAFHVGFCAPRQLKGFADTAWSRCEMYFDKKVKAGKEVKDYAKLSDTICARLKRGWRPVPYDDYQLKRDLQEKGYREVDSDKTYMWFAKDEENVKVQVQGTLF